MSWMKQTGRALQRLQGGCDAGAHSQDAGMYEALWLWAKARVGEGALCNWLKQKWCAA